MLHNCTHTLRILDRIPCAQHSYTKGVECEGFIGYVETVAWPCADCERASKQREDSDVEGRGCWRENGAAVVSALHPSKRWIWSVRRGGRLDLGLSASARSVFRYASSKPTNLGRRVAMPHKAAERKAAPAAKERGHPKAKPDVEVEDTPSTHGIASAPAPLVLKQTTVFASLTGSPVSAIEALKAVAGDKTAERDWAEPEHARDSDVKQAGGQKHNRDGEKDPKLITIMETIHEVEE
ncbi:MAG: hypothetical protein Q9191_003708 [Dirinaria sp. TL-2023a]